MIRAGELRHQVTIEEPLERQDAAGEPVKYWEPIPNGATWAKKEDLSGVELFQAQQMNAKVTTRFTLRHRTDVDARMRVRWGDLYYSIEVPMDPDGMGVALVLLCARSVN